jgi:hypothetical protein
MVSPASAAAPGNDDFADADPILEGVEEYADLRDATEEGTEELCDNGPTAWWEFTAPVAGDYLVYATGSNFDTEVGYSDAVDNSIGECNDDEDGSYDTVDGPETMATDDKIYVQLGHNSDGDRGSGGVGVVRAFPVADDFADRDAVTSRPGTPVAVRGFTFDGSEGTETSEPDECGAETTTDTGWLSFTPATSGPWMLELKSTEVFSFTVFTGSAIGSLTPITCSVGGHRAVAVALTAGMEYSIQIQSNDDTGDGVFRAEPANKIRGMAQVIDATGDGADTQSGDASAAALLDDGRPIVAHVLHNNSSGDGSIVVSERSADGTWDRVVVDSWTAGDYANVVDIVVLPSGDPAVAYRNPTDSTLHYAQRSGATWTTTTVDGSGTVSDALSLIVLADDNPAIAYGDDNTVRFAERNGGTWSDVLVDDDGDGTSTDVDDDIDAILFEGEPAIAFADNTNDEQRLARRSSGTWSDTLVLGTKPLTGAVDYQGADGRPGLSINPDGDLVIVIQDDDNGHTSYGHFDGTTWEFEEILTNRLIAELGWSSTARVLFDKAGMPVIIWQDDNYGGHVGASAWNGTRWIEQISVAQLSDPLDATTTGGGTSFADHIDTILMADGRLAWTTPDNETGDLYWVEDQHRVCPMGASPFTDVSATSFAKLDIPCIFGLGITTGTSATEYSPDDFVTREQMAAFMARLYRQLTGHECSGGTSPFTDVSATSFAKLDIPCIFGLGITTGTTGTTYSPDDFVTREQMAAFLARLYRLVTDAGCSGGASPFTDVSATSFAKLDIPCIFGLGITTGTSPTEYSPADFVTREQMAAFIGRFWRTKAAFPS